MLHGALRKARISRKARILKFGFREILGNHQLHNTHITASSQSAGDDYYHPFHLHGSNTSQQLTGVAHYPTTLHCQPSSPCLQNYSPCNHYKLLQRRTEAHRKWTLPQFILSWFCWYATFIIPTASASRQKTSLICYYSPIHMNEPLRLL